MKRKLFTALLSVIAAFCLWAYVITVEKPESQNTYYNIPVVLEGESVLADRGLMLVDGENSTITMTLYGNRTYLNKINSSNITVVADLTKIYDAGTKELSYAYSFPGEIPNNAISVLRRVPTQVTVVVANRISKEIPVQINYVGETPDSTKYIVDKVNAQLDYPNIRVEGPDTVIDQLHHAKIEVDLTDRTQSFSESFRYTLCDAEGNGVDSELVTTNVAEVRLDLKIQRFKDVELVVNVVNGGGATKDNSSIEIEPKTIRVSGNEAVLEKLASITLGTINLGELLQDQTLTFPITLDEGVTNLTGVTEATVNVSFPNLRTKEFSVTNIQVVNVPQGKVTELVTKVLKVSIRGPKESIEKMTKDDISVTVDMIDAEDGSTIREAQIVISDKYQDVGEVGTYSVSVTLQNEADTTNPTGS